MSSRKHSLYKIPNKMMIRRFKTCTSLKTIRHAFFDMDSTLIDNECIDDMAACFGVGEQVALYLMCVGKCVARGNDADSFAVVTCRGDMAELVKIRFAKKTEEVLELYFFDKNGKLRRICSFTSGECHRVTVKPEEVIKLISSSRPYGMVIAHNHTSGSPRPSVADDDFTRECQVICSMNNVRLYDHMIYASGYDIYSYFECGRMSEIEREYSIGSILKNGKKT